MSNIADVCAAMWERRLPEKAYLLTADTKGAATLLSSHTPLIIVTFAHLDCLLFLISKTIKNANSQMRQQYAYA